MPRRTPTMRNKVAALRVSNLTPDTPASTELDLRATVTAFGLRGLKGVIVPKDGIKESKTFGLNRGFAFLRFDELRAADALAALDGYRMGASIISAKLDNGTLLANAACGAEEINGPPLPLVSEFPTLPEPAPAVAPLPVQRPAVVHTPRERPSRTSESDAASDITTSSAPTVRASSCAYCKQLGHVVRACPELAARHCSYCSFLGHTQKFCEVKRSNERLRERQERLKNRQADRALRLHEQEATGWCTVGKAALTESVVCVSCPAVEEEEEEVQCQAQVAGAVEAEEIKRPSRAQRQAAKRIAARELRASAILA
mmetsp:Transcript_18236/g.45469  ORF Transcript_18236/g.45469 Transcript_18236/m.45469 type:complete len:315 (-) Transcript_18236:743-1687(-)